MKQKLLFTLLLLLFASSNILAEDDPQVTAPPMFTFTEESEYAIITFNCEDEDATIYAYINGDSFEFQNGDSYYIEYTYVEQELEIFAYAQAPGKSPSDVVQDYYYIPALVMEQTSAPEIYFLQDNDHALILFNCEADATIYASINDDFFEFQDGDTYWIDYTYEEQIISVIAYAVAPDKEPSETVEYYFAIPALPMSQTAAPEISYAVSNQGEVCVYIDCYDDPGAAIYYRIFQRYEWDDAWYGDESWYEYYGPFYITNYEYDDKFFRIEAYAKADGKTESLIMVMEFYLPHASTGTLTYDFCVDGIYYKRLGYNTVEVTRQNFDYYHSIGWKGNELDIHGYQYTSYSGNVVIPNSVNYGNTTYTVVGIGHEAFFDCSLTSLELPNSITSINQFAFANASIGSFTIPESVTSIGQGAFYNCDVSNLNITTPLVSLGKGAFCRCEGLSGVVLSDQITAIEDYTFLGCSNLESQEFLSNVTSIGEEAFSCTSFESVVIPDAVTRIGLGAYSECPNLVSVTLPASLDTISDYLFSGCTLLSNISMPNSLTHIGNYAFSRCSNLTEINLPTSLTSIGYSAFARCTGLSNVVIPNAVSYIGNSAFMGCTGLVNVTLPASLEAINYYTFSGCTNLSTITIPNAVTSISYYAFSDCAALTGINLPASVASISMRAFDGCSSLLTITVDGNNTVFDSRDNCNAIISTADNTLVLGCKNTVIPGTVTAIGECAFSGCTGLTSMTIPNSVTAIGDYAFFNCMEMESITLSESLKTIGNYAFFYCMGLTDITLPASVETISNNAFYCCNGLQTITCLATTPPEVFNATFISCYGATLCVPAESLADYQAADYWNQFANIQPIGGTQPGDLNGDGVLSVQDVTGLISLVLSGGEYSAAADVNGDGIVNVADVTALIHMVLGGGN